MKKTIHILLCLVLLMLCGCQKEPAQEPITNLSETNKQRLIREIDGAYKEEQKLPENSTTIGMVELSNKYADKWAQVADEYYNKLMTHKVNPPSESYYSSDDLHIFVSDMKTNWEQYYQEHCKNYLGILKTHYQGGTIVGPLMAEYRYSMQMEWALELVGICQMFNIK